MSKQAKIDFILEKVAKHETPTKVKREKILEAAGKLKRKVEEEVEKRGLEAEVSIQGSVAKDTWLRNDVDIDIFIAASITEEREILASAYMDAARSSVKGLRQIERFAEHPYVEAFLNGEIRVNIVPCYQAQPPNWKSATDRTIYHTKYITSRLKTEGQKREVRILKRFMKGIGVYGADIKTGGFSGYLTELMSLKYGNFQDILKVASSWKYKEIVDVENLLGETDEAKQLFQEPLIFIDPVDKYRNVAAAVRLESLNLFQAALKFFLKKPSLDFFYPPETKALRPKKLVGMLDEHKADLIFIKFNRIEAVPDILWGQLYKTEKAVGNFLEKFNFKTLRSAVWSDERKASVILFELENVTLKNVKKHYGPPVSSTEEENFIYKYLRSPTAISGPYIENGRWAVIIKRKYTDAKTLLKEKLERSPVDIGVASKISQAIKEGYKLYLNGEILEFYRYNQAFTNFLTKFLSGKPDWLD